MHPNKSIKPSAARKIAIIACALPLVGVPFAQATDGSWNVNASGNWSDAARWSTNPAVPGGAASVINLGFNISTGGRTVTIDTTSRTAGIINIGDTDGTSIYTLAASGGASLIMDNSGAGAQINQTSASAANIISTGIVLNDNLLVTNASSSLMTFSGGFSSSGTTDLTIQANGSGGITFSGTLSQAGAIINSGSGTGAVNFSLPLGSNITGVVQNSASSSLTLTAQTLSSFTGPVQVVQGTLIAASKNASLPLGTATIQLGDTTGENSHNATLALGPVNIAGGTLANDITVNAGSSGTLSLASLNNSTSFTGNIALNNNLTVDGVAGQTLTLGGTITQGGSSALTLTRTSQAGAGNGNVNITGNVIVGSGGLKLVGANASSAASAVSGNIAGTGNLEIAANGSTTTSGFTLSGSVNHVGTFTNSGTGMGVITVSGVIGANVTAVIQNSATSLLNLSNANAYSGATEINAGTLSLGAGGSINANSAITVAAGAIFDTTAKASYAFSNSTATTIGVSQTAAGLIQAASLTFSGANLVFDFDTTATLSSSYTILTMSGEVGDFANVSASGTSISGAFVNGGFGVWTLNSGGYDLTFSESLGTLTASGASVPEPSVFALLSGVGVLLVAGSRRKARL